MKSPFWYWESALSPALCDLALLEMAELQSQQGAVGLGQGETNTQIRNSRICWAKQNHWLEAVLYNHAIYANEQCGWVKVVGRPEQVQLTRYDKEGHYDWHQDWGPLEDNDTVRKLSVVALLNDESEFEGGAFEMKLTEIPKLKRGSILVFPSWAEHRVAPVTDGQRVSAVCWVRGPQTF